MMTRQTPISVLLVDDHPLVTEGIGACLETWDNITIAATAANGREGIEAACRIKPDIILMDINLPDMTGLAATRHIRIRQPHSKIIILSMHDNREYVISAIEEGACGYLLKDVSSSEVATAIQTVHRGGNYFSTDVAKALATPKQHSILTIREADVLAILAKGSTNKMIGRELGISERTVETHRKNIKRKLGITTTAGLTRYAMENDLTN